jgi:CheY-like chemotaxis protein
MLNKLGHRVDIVADGAAAVQAAAEHRYDVVLMDVQMPQMDGLEATRRIRAQSQRGSQPHIVALTASALVEDREACAAAGMEAYLTKPVRVAELQAMLERTTTTLIRFSESGHLGWGDDTQIARPTEAKQVVAAVEVAALDDLMEQMGGGPDIRRELIDSYLDDGQDRIDSLSLAAGIADTTTVAQVAHALRSSSAQLGATVLANLLEQIENAARTAPSEISALALEILDEYPRVARALKRLRSASPETSPPVPPRPE